MFLKIKYIIQGYWNLVISKFKELRYHELYESRLKVCKLCNKNRYGTCSICGCLVEAKTKSDSICPLKKWK